VSGSRRGDAGLTWAKVAKVLPGGVGGRRRPISRLPVLSRWLLGSAVMAVAACGSSPSAPTSTVQPPAVGVSPSPPSTTTPEPQPPAPRLDVSTILCFGDSLTEGYIAVSPSWLQAARAESYPSRLQSMLSARYRDQQIVVENAGLSGEWAADGQERFVAVARAARPDVVVLMEGANDINGFGSLGIDLALEALENMLRDGRALGAKVLLASLPPERAGSTEGGAASLVPEFNARVRRLAERQNIFFVDVHAAFGGDLSLIGPDGLHPTAAGYDRIAQAVFDVIRVNFEKPAASSVPATGPATGVGSHFTNRVKAFPTPMEETEM
jgi:lysophospholipase L1-like esterase